MTLGVVVLKIWALHIPGSSNPLGIDVKGPQDTLPFHPYFTVKDAFSLGIYLLLFSIIVFFAPNLFGNPDNYIPANSLATPRRDRARVVSAAVLRDPQILHGRFLLHSRQAAGRDRHARLDNGAVLPALA